MSTKVYIGRKQLAMMGVHHWAVKVGSVWYEIKGAGKKANNSPNEIVVSYGGCSAGGAQVQSCVGKTYKDHEDITNFNDRWMKKHPKYNFMWGNCQIYARELVIWCCGVNVAWPPNFNIESSAPTGRVGQNTHFIKDSGSIKASVGHLTLDGNIGPVRGLVAGPKAAFEAYNDGNNLGVFADVEAYRAEADIGIASAAYAPNVSTGVGVRNGNVEASFLGFGMGVGEDGFKVKTPLVEVKACSVM